MRVTASLELWSRGSFTFDREAHKVMSAIASDAYFINGIIAGADGIARVVASTVRDNTRVRASSSLILKTIFIKSEPMSAILVKMPPRYAALPRRATHRWQSR